MNDKGKTDSQRQTFEMVTDLPCCAFGYVIIGHFKMGCFLSLAHGRKNKVICQKPILIWEKQSLLHQGLSFAFDNCKIRI